MITPDSMGDMEFKLAVIRRQQMKSEIREAKLQKKGLPPKPRTLPALEQVAKLSAVE